MATSISKLSVILTANADRFKSGMRGAGRSVLGFGNSFKLGFAGVAGAVVGATAAITAFVNRVGSDIDKLGKFADRIGIMPERLAEIQFAAGQASGLGVEQVNMALQRMTRRVSEAAAGTGEAKKAIAELGLDAKKLAQLSPDKQFAVLADAMKNVGNKSDQLRLAFKLFDSEGAGLVSTLRLGSEGLAEMASEADSLGLTFRAGLSDKAAEVMDAFDRFKQSIKGLAAALFETLADPVRFVMNRLSELVSFLRRVISGEMFGRGGKFDTASRIEEIKEAAEEATAALDEAADAKERLMQTRISRDELELKDLKNAALAQSVLGDRSVSEFRKSIDDAIQKGFDEIDPRRPILRQWEQIRAAFDAGLIDERQMEAMSQILGRKLMQITEADRKKREEEEERRHEELMQKQEEHRSLLSDIADASSRILSLEGVSFSLSEISAALGIIARQRVPSRV